MYLGGCEEESDVYLLKVSRVLSIPGLYLDSTEYLQLYVGISFSICALYYSTLLVSIFMYISLSGKTSVGPVIQHMWDQEKEHKAKFEELIPRYRVRPTVLVPLWNVAGFALGAGEYSHSYFPLSQFI